jgi:Asp-tRNA(Asn)/Glu-tRNA(Gln) amidotransferase C subunit
MTPSQSEWQHLAEQASNEMDPEKLMHLVTQLNRVLGEQEERSRALLHRGNESMSFPAAV